MLKYIMYIMLLKHLFCTLQVHKSVIKMLQLIKHIEFRKTKQCEKVHQNGFDIPTLK